MTKITIRNDVIVIETNKDLISMELEKEGSTEVNPQSEQRKLGSING